MIITTLKTVYTELNTGLCHSVLFACVCVRACVRACVRVCLVHPPSAQVLQSNLIKLGHMDHWGT